MKRAGFVLLVASLCVLSFVAGRETVPTVPTDPFVAQTMYWICRNCDVLTETTDAYSDVRVMTGLKCREMVQADDNRMLAPRLQTVGDPSDLVGP